MQPVQGIFPAEAGYGLDGVLRAISINRLLSIVVYASRHVHIAAFNAFRVCI